MEIPENVINKTLYIKAKDVADKTYKRNSVYKSMFTVKKYKELGGKYKKSDDDKDKGTSLWLKQQWLSVEDYLDGNKISCGSDKLGKNLCRPLFKQGENILTIKDVIKIHGEDKVRQIIKQKKKNMNKKIDWTNLKMI